MNHDHEIEKLVNLEFLQYISGLNYRTVKKRLGHLEPIKSSGKSNLFDAKEAITRVFAKDEVKKQFDLQEERARLAAAQADKVRLEHLKMLGKLIIADDATQWWESKAAAIKAKILALPTTAAPNLVDLNAEEIEHNLKQLVYELLEELSQES